MENLERLKLAGVLNPYGELTPELSAAIDSLTPDEVDDLISGKERLRVASADEDQRPIIAPPPDKDKDKDEGQRPIIAPPPSRPGEDEEEEDDEEGSDGARCP